MGNIKSNGRKTLLWRDHFRVSRRPGKTRRDGHQVQSRLNSFLASTNGSLRVTVGPERMVLTDGIQPFLFYSNKGTLFLQAHLSALPEFLATKPNGVGIVGNVISRDGGDTWHRWRPKEWQKRPPHFEGAFTQLSDATILMIERLAEPTQRRGTFAVNVWESSDDLKTLGISIRATIDLPQARARGYDDGGNPCAGFTFHRGLLELPGGDLLATIYCWFTTDTTPCSYQPKMRKLRCVLLRSRDRGRHWTYVSTVAADSRVGEEGFNESAMVRLSKGEKTGRLLCLMRTGCHDCAIHQATSDDDGETWSKPRALPF